MRPSLINVFKQIVLSLILLSGLHLTNCKVVDDCSILEPSCNPLATLLVLDFLNPRSIAGLNFWFDASAAGKIDGATINTWPDSSGNGYLGIASGSPVFRSNAFGSRPGVTFNSSSVVAANVSGFSQDFVFAFVVKRSSFGTFQNIINFDNATGGSNGFSLYFNTFDNFRMDKTGCCGGVTPGTLYTTSGAVQITVTGSSSAPPTFYDAGTAITTGTIQSYTPGSVVTLGASSTGGQVLFGEIAEVVHYKTLLSAENITLLNCYLTRKYSIPSNLTCPSNLFPL
ncbi:MAG: LamG domain-containing protein [Spirochaetia bacterium]|nr:LamG domain-containing protein [Spirochaetia bacterium]